MSVKALKKKQSDLKRNIVQDLTLMTGQKSNATKNFSSDEINSVNHGR